jgi:hypothetical protein
VSEYLWQFAASYKFDNTHNRNLCAQDKQKLLKIKYRIVHNKVYWKMAALLEHHVGHACG